MTGGRTDGEAAPNGGDAPAARLTLFGPLTFDGGDGPVPLGGRPAQLVALLALQRGAPVSAERLLDQLWTEAPPSGLNALQRHVSTARRLLAEAGAPGVITYRDGTYRLDPVVVRSDLDLLQDPERAPSGPEAGGESAVAWWREPLMGLPYEGFVEARAMLEQVAVAAARAWLAHDPDGRPAEAVIEALSPLADRHPEDEVLQANFEAALAVGRPAIGASRAGRRWVDAAQPRLLARVDGVAEPALCWLAGDVQGAQELLDKHRPVIRPDTARRIERVFANLDPADGMGRSLLSGLVAEASTFPLGAERCLVSLDARALVHQPDGLVRARAERATASSFEDRLRAQRVLVFVLLGAPLRDGFSAAIDDLASFDDPEAQAEAGRFQVAERIRRGAFNGLLELLEDVSRSLAELGPGHGWFRSSVRFALHSYRPTRSLVPELAPEELLQAGVVDDAVINTGTLWRRLEDGELSASTPAQLRQAANEHSIPSAVAFETLYLLAAGRLDDAANRIAPYRGRLAQLPRTPFFHLLPVAAARVALAIGDDHLGAEVATTLEPWAGELLGNFELIIEPTDDLLSELAAQRPPPSAPSDNPAACSPVAHQSRGAS